MNKYALLILSIVLLAPALVDQLDSHFLQGNYTNINVSSNELTLVQSGGVYTTPGTFESRIFDLGSNPQANITWNAASPSQTSILVTSRSGPTNTPNSNWSSYSAAYANPDELTTPANRYHQYRLQLSTTDTTQTPIIGLVRIDYEEQGTLLSEDTNQNQELDEETTGAYRFYVTATDTVPINTLQARHRIASQSFSSYQPLTAQNQTHYYIDITETWSDHPGEDLEIEVQAINNQSNTTTQTFIVEIIDINSPPVLDSINDQQAIEGEELEITITASDQDNNNLTYTTTHGTITKFTNIIADFSWTPQGGDVGLVNVTITVSDGQDTDQQTFEVNTTASNKPPVIRQLQDITVYFGDKVIFDVVVDDLNQNENLTFQATPNIPLQEITNSTVSTTYIARANFSVFDNWKGQNTVYITAQDQTSLSDTKNFTLTVNYCGDSVCQAQEDVNTCAQDCQTVQDTRRSFIALDFPARMCTNQTINITAYNASSRYVCFLDGKTTDDAAAWCSELEGVNYQFYRLNGTQRTQLSSQTTNQEGQASFTTQQDGQYRVVATADEFVSTQELFTIRNCNQDISNQQQIIRTSAPDIEAQPLPELPARTERPQVTSQPVSILSILIWYMIIPLLLAGFIYTTNAYYELNKDTDPKILAMRIRMQELHNTYWPKIEPYYTKIQQALAPATRIINVKLIQPIKKRLKPILKKLSKR